MAYLTRHAHRRLAQPRKEQLMLKLVPTTLAAALAFALPQLASAANTITVPAVPQNIVVDATANKVFFVGHATGTQNYVCQPSGSGVAFVLFTPQATLFDDYGQQVITHFFSPNPKENNTNPAVVSDGAIRATWQFKDTSSVWAKVNTGDASTDQNFVHEGAVAWLKLTAVGTLEGPTGGDKLTKVTFIQRLNTEGGVAPKTGCASATDIGNQAFEPYTADYFFYKAR
jgi:hypothetical protein